MKWEYKAVSTLSYDDEKIDLTESLNTLGEDDWELIQFDL